MSGLPRSLRGHDTIWVVVDCLTKSMHFLPIRVSNLVEDLSVIYVHEIVRLHRVSVLIVFYRDAHFTLLFFKGMQSVLGSDLRFNTTFHSQNDK